MLQVNKQAPRKQYIYSAYTEGVNKQLIYINNNKNFSIKDQKLEPRFRNKL